LNAVRRQFDHSFFVKEQPSLNRVVSFLQKWAPTNNVKYILETLRNLIADPNPDDSPLETDIAQQICEDKAAYEATAAKWTADYAGAS
jgi:ubiquitin-protein ligase